MDEFKEQLDIENIMKNQKRTPGPWIAIASDGKQVGLPMICHESQADAQLIAAAPEMLESLETAHRVLLLANKLQSAHEVELVIKKAKGI